MRNTPADYIRMMEIVGRCREEVYRAGRVPNNATRELLARFGHQGVRRGTVVEVVEEVIEHMEAQRTSGAGPSKRSKADLEVAGSSHGGGPGEASGDQAEERGGEEEGEGGNEGGCGGPHKGPVETKGLFRGGQQATGSTRDRGREGQSAASSQCSRHQGEKEGVASTRRARRGRGEGSASGEGVGGRKARRNTRRREEGGAEGGAVPLPRRMPKRQRKQGCGVGRGVGGSAPPSRVGGVDSEGDGAWAEGAREGLGSGGGREKEAEATGGVLHGCRHEQITGGHGGARGTLHDQGMQEGQGQVKRRAEAGTEKQEGEEQGPQGEGGQGRKKQRRSDRVRTARQVACMHAEVWIEEGIVPVEAVRRGRPLTATFVAGHKQKRAAQGTAESRKRRRQETARKCKRQREKEKDPPQGGERAKRAKVQSRDSDQRDEGERGKRQQG